MQRILVTGANKGIGFALVELILNTVPKAHVLLGTRNLERGEQAKQKLVEATPEFKDRVDVLEIDVSDEKSVVAAAATVVAKYGKESESESESESEPLYAIVNNAGVLGAPNFDDQNFADIHKVNLLGVHYVCQHFVPLLDPSKGRVVSVGSSAGPQFVGKCTAKRQAQLTDPDITWDKIEALLTVCREANKGGKEELQAQGFEVAGLHPYCISKALVACQTMALAKEHPKLSINCCNPGWIATDMTKGMVSEGKTQLEMGMVPSTEGLKPLAHLLFAEDLEGNGNYYESNAKRAPLSSASAY